MFKWLDGIAQQKARYSKGVFVGSNMRDIIVRFGSVYATNGIILARVDYPEFEHIADDGWKRVEAYFDGKGYLLETPELADTITDMRPDIFNDMFINTVVNEPVMEFKFNPDVMMDALKPFKIHGIQPVFTCDGMKGEFSGHDKDVSIRVCFMGVRK
jgi:hypothetical protein